MHHGVTFNFGSYKVSSPAIFMTSYDKDISVAATDYYVHFCIIVLFLLTAILQLIIFFLSLRFYFIYLNIIWSFG